MGRKQKRYPVVVLDPLLVLLDMCYLYMMKA
jgi:hypothetical protein